MDSIRRAKLRKLAKEFHARNGYRPYTMTDNKILEAEMKDENLPPAQRVTSAIRRLSWGNLEDYAVSCPPKLENTDPTPQTITQERLADILGISTGATSKICSILRKQGYLKNSINKLIPNRSLESITYVGVGSDSGNLSHFRMFRESLVSERPELAKSLTWAETGIKALNEEYEPKYEPYRAEKKRIERLILGAWRDHQRTQSKSTERNKGENENLEKFPTPASRTANSETGKRTKANESRVSGESPFNPLNVRSEPAVSSSQKNLKGEGAGTHAEAPTTETNCVRAYTPAQVIASIPPALIIKLGDTPRGALLTRITAKLAGIPLDRFTAKIVERFTDINSMGLLEKLAEQVAEVYRQEIENPDAATAPHKPMNRQETRDAELLRGMEVFDRIRDKIG